MTLQHEKLIKITETANRMRRLALTMAYSAGKAGAHLGGGLSCIEILAVLYTAILRFDRNHPESPDRDRFLISKAHGVLAYYSALYEAGFLSDSDIESFEKDGGSLAGHPVRNLQKGIEYSGGSLGMAFSAGIGMAAAAKSDHRPSRVYLLLGDGECDEGSNWEAFLTAPNWKLDNLTVIIDANRLQYDGTTTDIMDLSPLAEKLNSFHWDVHEIDGHNIHQIYDALTSPKTCLPHAVIANTVKGKGVSFMEGRKEWHHAVLTEKLYKAALEELEQIQ